MTRTNRSLRVLCSVALPLLLLTACGGEDANKPAEPTSAALESEATKMTTALANHDYAAAYESRSARCRLTLNKDDYVASMGQKYDGRDLLSKPSEVTVTTSGESGQVTTKNFDVGAGEDDPDPAKWTFIEGKWQFDNC